MTEPSSPVGTYGVTFVGQPLTWQSYDEKGELVRLQFRPHVGISFDDIVEHAQIRAELLTSAFIESRQSKVNLDEVDVNDDEAATAAMEDLLRRTEASDKARMDMVVRSCLMLVAPGDREGLEPLLRTSTPVAVRQLHDDLEQIVIHRVELQVEAAGHVDPTSPPPPSDS